MSWNLSLKLNNLSNYVYSLFPTSSALRINNINTVSPGDTLTITGGTIALNGTTSIGTGNITTANITTANTTTANTTTQYLTNLGSTVSNGATINLTVPTASTANLALGILDFSTYVSMKATSASSVLIALTVPSLPNGFLANGQSITVSGVGAPWNGVYTVTYGGGITTSSNTYTLNNPSGIITGTTTTTLGTISYLNSTSNTALGSISSSGLTINNLNGKLGIVGGTSNSGNVILCNNTTSTSGNFDLLTDSNQHLRFAGGSNLLTIGGATNGGIAIPGTAGSIVCDTYASNASTKMTLNTKNGTIELQNNGTKIGDILYANANYPLQILGTGGVSIDSGTNTDLNISAGRASSGRTINFFTAGAIRGAIKDAGAAFDTYVSYSGGNLTITSYTGSGNPGIIFNANAYNNNALSGNYGYINAGGWYFNDGNSSGASQSCGINNVGFYVPNAGYFINGARYNSFFGSLYNSADMVFYNNAGQGIAFNVLGTGTVYSNGGRLTNTNPSDRTLKENITPFKPQLENILKLKPVSYNWIDRLRNGDKLYNGFVAQDAQEIDDISELVSTFKDVFDNEKLGFDVVGLVPFIVKAIQEQNQIVKDQQKQIDELKLLVNQLLNK